MIRKKRVLSETAGVTAPCLALLENLRKKGKPIIATRTNAGKILTKQGYCVYLCREGWSDITATIAGKSVQIETKIRKGKLSDGQEKMKKMQEDAGGEYWVIRNMAELKNKLSNLGLLDT